MEIIRSDKGKARGRVSVARTLSTMKRHETWETTTAEVDPDYVRAACAKLARLTGKQFNVSHTLSMGTQVVIRRTL